MNAQTPISAERSILEFMADPERPKQLLELMKQAEAAEAKAIEAQANAQVVLDANTAMLAKERELQAINTGKSAALQREKAELAEAVRAMEAAKADDIARLTEWENRLKGQADLQAEEQAKLDALHNKLVSDGAALDDRVAAAQEVIARAERIKAASES